MVPRMTPTFVSLSCGQGQIRFLNNSDYITSMLGAIATEGYHAGAVRELLIQQAGAMVAPYGLSVNQVAQVSSRLLTLL